MTGFGGFYPQAMTGSNTANMTAKLSCENCKRLLEALDKVSHTAFHWQALGIAHDALKPPKEDK